MGKKLTIILFTSIFLLTLAVGCQGSEPGDSSSNTGDGSDNNYSVASFNSGTFQYMYVAALSGLTRPILDDITLSTEATGGTSENLDLLRRGEAELGLASPERLYDAYNGINDYEGEETPLGILWGYMQQAALLFAKEDSDIESFYDLEGKSVAIGPAGSSNELKNAFILDAYGYTREGDSFDFEELETVSMTYPEAANALAEGVVDAVIATQALPDMSFYELALQIPLTIIPIDENMYEEVLEVYPWLWPTTIPAEIYPDQEEAMESLGDPNYVVGSLENLSEEDAYNLTKVYVEQVLPQLAEQFDAVIPYSKDPSLLTSSWVIPGHPGAVKYYEEAGIDIDTIEVDE